MGVVVNWCGVCKRDGESVSHVIIEGLRYLDLGAIWFGLWSGFGSPSRVMISSS